MPMASKIKHHLERFHLLWWITERLHWIWENAGWGWAAMLALLSIGYPWWSGLKIADKASIAVISLIAVGMLTLFARWCYLQWRLAPPIAVEGHTTTSLPIWRSPRMIVSGLVALVVVLGGSLSYWLSHERLTSGETDQLRKMLMKARMDVFAGKRAEYDRQRSVLYASQLKNINQFCSSINIPADRIDEECRIELGPGPTGRIFHVPIPRTADVDSASLPRRCFGYDASRLYATNKITTTYTMGGSYTIIGDRNWPVGFQSQEEADQFLLLARAFKRACSIGGVGRPTLSDVVFEWEEPSGSKPPAANCRAISGPNLTSVENPDATVVLDGGLPILRFGSIAEARAAVEASNKHSELCSFMTGPEIRGFPGDRVMYWR